MPRIWGGAAALVVFVCAAATAWSQSSTARMPREIRSGAAEMIIQRAEPGVSPLEILDAVQAQLDRETMCFPWPGVWLDASDRRRVFLVRYDLMLRDWGADVAERGRQRMQDFVDMGLLTARQRPEIGAGAVEYLLTSEGYERLTGSLSGGRLSFCLPAERRVIAVAETELGDFACGTLRTRFTHVADAWPSWARTEVARARIAEAWGPIGVPGDGVVSMSRQWFNSEPRDGRENGQLRSLCYDEATRQVRGEDMELYLATPAP